MDKTFSSVFLVASALALGACGGDGDLTGVGTGGGTGGGTDGGTDGGGTVKMTMASGLSSLSAGGSTGLTLKFTQGGTPYTGDSSASFNSDCVGDGTATITINTALPTTSGTINATYLDQGCGKVDTVTTVASANGQTLSASVDIDVEVAEVGSIQFVSTSPDIIGIRGGGSGLPEQSTVTFQVLNTAGGPAAGRDVAFTLNNTNGGIEFGDGQTSTTGISDASGFAAVVVRAGTVLTSVRVTAKFTDTDSGAVLTTQSSNLTVSTGFPDQNSFSLSVDRLNNEGFACDGEEAIFNMRASDRNNNPVPSGTAITFTTEGGDIVSTCFTGGGTGEAGTQAGGICTVDWESQNPRPSDGRSTVLAYAEGEESFVDLNSNGVFDDGDTFTDLGEAFHDLNENGTRDADEPYIEFNGTPGYQAAGDGKYNGLLCQHSTLCGAQDTVNVRESLVLVMGTGVAFVEAADVTITDAASGDLNVDFVGKNSPATFQMVVRDGNDQIMPLGTTVSIASDLGSVSGANSFTVGNSNNSSAVANSFVFFLKGPEGTDPDNGAVTVTVQSPASACGTRAPQIYQFQANYTP